MRYANSNSSLRVGRRTGSSSYIRWKEPNGNNWSKRESAMTIRENNHQQSKLRLFENSRSLADLSAACADVSLLHSSYLPGWHTGPITGIVICAPIFPPRETLGSNGRRGSPRRCEPPESMQAGPAHALLVFCIGPTPEGPILCP